MIEFDPGRYAVDDVGNVFSLINNHGRPRTAPMRLQANLQPDGYVGIVLPLSTGRKFCLVHRLVAEAYIPNPEGKPEVNHKNGDKSDNDESNLEWVTRSENSLHAYELGLRTPNRGQLGRTNEKSVLSKPVLRISKDGQIMERYPSMSEAQRQGYSQGNIGSVIAGKRQSHKGWVWAFE